MIGLLIDVTRCTGCEKCVQACVEANRLGPDLPWPQQTTDGLSAQRWTTIMVQPGGHYVRKLCRHCLEPACVSVCPARAMRKLAEGPVVYDPGKCLGCRYCMMACPYGIPRYEWTSTAPVVAKCQLCWSRLQSGEAPACVEACPEGATRFGDRNELLAEARRRLDAEPDRYLPRIYGEEDVGGTSVLYISDVPLDFLDYHGASGQRPLPELTQTALNAVPVVASGLTVFLAGFSWVIRRRMKLMPHRDLDVELPCDSQ